MITWIRRSERDAHPQTRSLRPGLASSSVAKNHRRRLEDLVRVICDSLQEGLLISWNAHTRAPVEAFVAPGLAGVPPEVADRFTRCRPFARHLGHWLVPLGIDTVPATQAEFAARYYVCVIPRSLSEPRMTHPERSAGGLGLKRTYVVRNRPNPRPPAAHPALCSGPAAVRRWRLANGELLVPGPNKSPIARWRLHRWRDVRAVREEVANRRSRLTPGPASCRPHPDSPAFIDAVQPRHKPNEASSAPPSRCRSATPQALRGKLRATVIDAVQPPPQAKGGEIRAPAI